MSPSLGGLVELSQREIAKAFRVTQRTLQRWDDEGLATARRGDAGAELRYDLAAAIDWLVQRERGSKLDPLTASRTKREATRAEREDLELAQLQGKFIHIDDLERLHVAPLATLRARLLALPGMIAAELPLDAVQTLEIVEPIVFAFMDDLSQDAPGEESA